MKQLYIGNKNYSSWSLRPAVLMRSLEIPFEEVLVPFDGPDNYQRYKAFSPNGRVPCLHDDNEIIWDSLAIIEYLGERNKQVWPTSGPARAFARSASSEMHAGFHVLRAHCPMICSAQFQIRELSPGLRRDLSRLDDLFCEGLTRFGGDFYRARVFLRWMRSFVPWRFESYITPCRCLSQAWITVTVFWRWMPCGTGCLRPGRSLGLMRRRKRQREFMQIFSKINGH